MYVTLSTLVWSTILTFFATAVVSYVAIATAIGPWIGPTLALISLVVFLPFCNSQKELVRAVCAGSLGGIIATAVGFSLPTLYFLNKAQFDLLLAQPVFFVVTVAGLIFVAGLLALYCAYQWRAALLDEEKLSFPIGQLVYRVMSSAEKKGKSRDLFAGLLGGFGYALAQTKIFFGTALIPATLKLWSGTKLWLFSVPRLQFDLTLAPMLVAIGFIAGHMITVPLLVGAVAKVLLIDPLHPLLFASLSVSDFTFAFCSGMVVSGALAGISRLAQQLYAACARKCTVRTMNSDRVTALFSAITLERVLLIGALGTYFLYLKFGVVAQIYLVVATGVWAYQIAYMAGKIGLAPLGRFATFVMVPGMFLFSWSALHITLVATFVELVGGIAAELLFGLKTAQLANVDERSVYWYQLFGIAVSACAATLVFYVLVTRLELGSAQLFAQRAQTRALLVQAASFNYYAVGLGFVFGIVLKRMKCNATLVLGGLLMPLSLSGALIAGGAVSSCVSDKQEYEPFCSGVYAANALAIFLRALL